MTSRSEGVAIPFLEHPPPPRTPSRFRERSAGTESLEYDPVERLAAVVAYRCGVSHAIPAPTGSASGTLALASLDHNPGDFVIVPAFAPAEVIAAVATLNLRPLFVDIDINLGLDPALVATTLEESCQLTHDQNGDPIVVHRYKQRPVRAVLVFHPFGRLASVRRLRPIAAEYDLPVIEFAGHAFGAMRWDRDEQRPAGSWGDLGCFSFDPSSSLAGPGDVGMVVTDDPVRARRVREVAAAMPFQLRYQCHDPSPRFDPFVAQVLLSRLATFDQQLEGRRRIAERYRDLLQPLARDGLLELPDPGPDGGHGYHRFVVRTVHRTEVARVLARRRIGHALYYSTLLHVRPGMSDLGYVQGACQEAESACVEALGLPLFPTLCPSDQDEVVELVTTTLRSIDRAGRSAQAT